MRRTSFAVIVVLAAVIAAAIAVTVHSLTTRTVTAWAMTVDAPAGTALGPGNVHQITVHQGTDDFTVLVAAPTGQVLAHAVKRGDVLRPDDLLQDAQVVVPISFKTAAPGLQPGDQVDVYGPAPSSLAAGGNSTGTGGSAGDQLYGRGITVVAVGSDAAIAVPARLEGYWVELAGAGVPLIAVRSAGIDVPPGQRYDLDTAERVLAGVADSGEGGTALATPSPTPGG